MSGPVIASRPPVQASERMEKILEEATKLFAQNGYAGTRMTDVAAAIGVTKPIVYRYFDSKQALFEALVRRVLERQTADARRRIDEHRGPVRPMLEDIVRDARAALAAPGALAPWRIAVGEADRFPDLAVFLRHEFMDPILGSLGGLFERAIEAGELKGADGATLARLFVAPIGAVAMLLATFGEAEEKRQDLDALLAAHIDGFWRGWSA